MSRVGVVGAGYVGLSTAAGLAHLGHRVVCADIDPEKVEGLRRGRAPVLEEGLPELLADGLAAGRLSFALGAGGAADGAEVVFLCVPTPPAADGATADLSHAEAAVTELAPRLAPGSVVVAKSTMPPGSSHLLRAWLGRDDVEVATNPEFLREGSAVADFLHPDRIVIGADDPATARRVAALYDRLRAPLVITDCASAELIKYAANAFLATKVSFVNAVANLCEVLGADVRDVTLGLGYDPRIGFTTLRPGPGYGGPCLPKDTAALIRTAEAAGYDFSLLRGVEAVNEAQGERMVAKVRDAVGGALAGAVIGVWGLTFKAGTDDTRSSPAVAIVGRLLAEGAEVRAHDPAAGKPAALVGRPGFALAADPYDACRDAGALAVLTEWDEYRWADFGRVKALMRRPAVVDTRNLLDHRALRRLGFDYRGVGHAPRL